MSGPSDAGEGGGVAMAVSPNGANAGVFRGVMVNSCNSLAGGNFSQQLHNRGGEREGKGGGEENFSPTDFDFDKAKEKDRRGMAARCVTCSASIFSCNCIDSFLCMTSGLLSCHTPAR